MGADLYIDSIYNKAIEKHKPAFDEAVERRNRLKAEGASEKEIEAVQAEVEKHYNAMYDHEGYFRDSYNSTSLFWQLGLSWWNDLQEFYDGDGNLRPAGAKRLLAKIKKIKLKKPTRESLEHAVVEEKGENSLESWHRYFRRKKARFEKFLQTAINLNEKIRCSC